MALLTTFKSVPSSAHLAATPSGSWRGRINSKKILHDGGSEGLKKVLTLAGAIRGDQNQKKKSGAIRGDGSKSSSKYLLCHPPFLPEIFHALYVFWAVLIQIKNPFGFFKIRGYFGDVKWVPSKWFPKYTYQIYICFGGANISEHLFKGRIDSLSVSI